MKTSLAFLLLVFVASSSLGAPAPAKGMRLGEIDVIPTRVLRRTVSPWFYKSLLVSPLEGWVVVRGQLSGTGLVGARVVRSDLDGTFDALALQRAREIKIAGDYKIDSQIKSSFVSLNLLVYKIADGIAALSFVVLDGAGGNQLDYFGCAQLAVRKDDGRWIEIKGPAGLQGKGYAVRPPGMRNDQAALKLERIPGGR